MFAFPYRIALPALAGILILVGCESQGPGPVLPPVIPCEDPSVLKLAPRPMSKHSKPVRLKGAPADLPGTTWAKAADVVAFFGGKPVKVVFTLNRRMYLA